MDNEANESGTDVKTRDVEPVVESPGQNGNTGSEDWKKVLEREKLEFEIEKIKAETVEFKKPFYKRQAYLQFSIPAIISLLAVLASLYFGFLDRNIKGKTEEIADKEAKIANLNKEIEGKTEGIDQLKVDAQKQLDDLNQQINSFQATTDKERKEKEAFESTNRNLQAAQAALQNRLNFLNSLKEKDQGLLDELRFDYIKLNTEISKANDRLKTARLEEPLAQLLAVGTEDDEATEEDESTDDGLSIGKATITRIYNTYPQNKKEYENYFRDALEKNSGLRQKLRIAVLMFALSGDAEWKNQSGLVIKEIIPRAVGGLLAGKSNGGFGLKEIVEEIDGITESNDSLSRMILDVLDREIKDLAAPNIRSAFLEIRRAVPSIRRHPIFFRFLETGVSLSQSQDEMEQREGLVLISNLATSRTRDIFVIRLMEAKRINLQLVAGMLDLRRKMGSKTLPTSVSELETWANLPQTKCLTGYWTEENWTKLRADSKLLEQVIDGNCK